MPTGFVPKQETESAIQRVQSKFAEQIDHINYNFGGNSFGAPSVFFRIVLRDEAAQSDRLLDLTRKISFSLEDEARTDENGLYAYFDFRSVSDQAKHRDLAWA